MLWSIKTWEKIKQPLCFSQKIWVSFAAIVEFSFRQSVLFTPLMTVKRKTITTKKELMEEFTLAQNFGSMGIHEGWQAW